MNHILLRAALVLIAFTGCAAPASSGDAGPDAPTGAGGCRSSNDCVGSPGGSICYGPAGDLGGRTLGPAPCSDFSVTPCTADGDCASMSSTYPYVCDPYSCPGGPGGSGMGCFPGCRSDADCLAEDSVCNANHRCVAHPCMGDADCPAWFECTSGACARRSCAHDDACHGGACVNGACYAGPGHCGGGDA